ncbi:MAG: Energy-coupling factor transporter ATP-binding protein EcfA2 [candidate division BRC1 bacterium ADurb.BinA364]|nr:MAG: Energy-coupling factor transporter ATP-binding protein EcfA2 [candidate division BRC1 bacterium ADurb.BinA364]
MDPEGSVEIWRVLREMSAEHGATVVVSSHLLHEIEEHCHRVCVLERGRAAAFGRVADLLADRRPLIEISFDSPETAEKARAWLCERGLASIEDLAPSVGEFEPSRRVHARVERQDAPTLNRALTEAGMAPIYLAPRRRTLRDYFLNGPR